MNKRTRNWSIAIVIATAGLIAFAVFNPVLLFTPRAHFEMQRCESVRPGMSEQQILSIVGPPQSRTLEPDGMLVLTYREPLFASAAPVTYLSLKGGTYVATDTICADLG